ncbi:MAG TPA: hypothetical protein VFG59_11365 [Anaeromyxobacter sp.]|nr:hypothetical protein [Anaeromyxobacter sp.]
MRKLLIGVLLAVGAGCGGGGGGSGPSGPATGTISGEAFTPTNVSAVIVGPPLSPCTEPTTFTPKAVALRFANVDMCTDLTSDPLCKFTASETTVTVAMADIEGTAGPTLAPGTFQVTPDPSNPSNVEVHLSGPLAGTATVAFAISTVTGAGAQCLPDLKTAAAQGSLTIDSMDTTAGGHVTGSLDLTLGTFSGGNFTAGQGTFKGTFDAILCSEDVSFDLCQLAAGAGTCGGTPTCN